MRGPANLNPFRLVLLAVALVSVPTTVLVSGPASSQVCVEEHPLYIPNVTAISLDADQDNVVTEEGAIFVTEGADLRFQVKIKNRVSEECREIYVADDSDDLRLKIFYLPNHGSEMTDPETLTDTYPLSSCGELNVNESCTPSVPLPENDDDRREIVAPTEDPPVGEQRVRFIVEDKRGDNDWMPLAGAERIVVVGVKPNLEPFATGGGEEIRWTDPADEEDRHTHYPDQTSGQGTAEFEVEAVNNGEYPLWNPNGGEAYVNRSPFDRRDDGDLEPDDGSTDATYTLSDTTAEAPPCRWADKEDKGNLNSGEPLCSYRGGNYLDMPVSWELRRDGELIQSGVSDDEVYSSGPYSDRDKDEAIAWQGYASHADGLEPGGSNIARNATISGIERTHKAGEYELSIDLDQDADGRSFTPESDENDNDENRKIDVLGADLEIEQHGIHPQSGQLCTEEKNPCQAGTLVTVNPTYHNVGDKEVDDTNVVGGAGPSWKGAVWLAVGKEDPSIAEAANAGEDDDSRAVTNNKDVPATWKDPQELKKDGWTIETDPEGGPHKFIIRLDHPDNYDPGDGGVSDEFGRIAERTDDFEDCPSDDDDDEKVIGDEADNTFCLTLYFEDNSRPSISDVSIDGTEKSEDVVPEVTEGEAAEFHATVTDNALENVTAVFNHTQPSANYSIEEPMEPVEDEADGYRVATNLSSVLGNEDNLGTWTFSVNATDLSHTNWSEEMEFELVELPKNVTEDTEGEDHSLNGNSTVRGSSAPRYEGTADEPENTFRLIVNVTGSGQDDQPDGKLLEIHEPDGTLNKTVQMQEIEACQADGDDIPDVGQDGDNPPETGDECNEEPESEKWSWWEVDNTDPAFEDEDIELGWVGEFNLTVNVTDVFGRVGKENFTFELRDQLNHDTNDLETTYVPEDEIEFGPTAADPGQRIGARAVARDILRVERVYLDVVHTDTGDSFEQNLSLSQTSEAATNNGTYTGSFVAGADGDVFDRAGTYEVELVGEDFGDNPNRTDLGTVAVNDTDDPTIASLVTEPQGTVEAGQQVEFFARIDDSTQIQPPTLTVTQASAGENTTDLVFNETSDRWELESPMLATLAAEGTWTYTLEVADYAGHAVSQSGELEIVANNAPTARNWQPAVGSGQTTFGPANATIQTDLLDTQGVNRSSITMTVNGETVLEEGEGEASVSAIPTKCSKCYRVSYQPPEAFDAGQVVTVQIQAADLSDPPKESGQQTHQFEVDKTGPSAAIDLTPALTDGNRRIVGATTDVNVSTSDAGAGPGPARVTVERLAGTTASTREVVKMEDGSGSLRLPDLDAFQGHGRYRIVVEPTDAVGNEGDSVQRIVLFDAAPPKIQQIPQLNKPRSFIGANVTDASSVRDVFVKFTADDGPQRQIRLELANGTWSGRIVNPETGQPYPENTTVEFRIEATDFWGNRVTTNQTSFTAGNAVPEIEIDKPQPGATLDGTVEVRWTARDAETSSSDLKISVWYKQDGGNPREIPGAKDIQNTGSYHLDTTLLPNGEVTLQTIVFDGSTFGSDTVDVTVQNLGDVFRSPEVRGAETVDGANVLAPGEETVFTVQIDGNVRAAWANVTRDGETVTSYDLEQTDGGSWQATFTAPDEPGEYAVDLAALTADGSPQTESAYTFEVQSADETGSFIPEWTILSVLFAGAVALGAFGLARRWE